jgi:hypothetical protein
MPNKPKVYKYQVSHPMHSGGPKFTCLTEALAYMAHAIRNGNDYLTLIKLT